LSQGRICPLYHDRTNHLQKGLMVMSNAQYKIFISSVQKELAEERRGIKDFILHDPLLCRFISHVFLFEDIPAKDRRPDDIYLDQVEGCDMYMGIFGDRYGWKNEDGKSPTELEFDHATKTRRERLIFIKGDDDKAREPEMAKLVKKAGSQLTRRRFFPRSHAPAWECTGTLRVRLRRMEAQKGVQK